MSNDSKTLPQGGSPIASAFTRPKLCPLKGSGFTLGELDARSPTPIFHAFLMVEKIPLKQIRDGLILGSGTLAYGNILFFLSHLYYAHISQ